MDYIVRATAAGGQIRAFATNTHDMVQKAAATHDTTPVASAALGRLMTAGAMMGIMMKGDRDLLSLTIRSDGPIGGLTVTADSHGNVKGFPYNPNVPVLISKRHKLDVGAALGNGTLTVVKDLGLKEPYSGQVDLQSGEIGDDLAYYFMTSEQIPSSVAEPHLHLQYADMAVSGLDDSQCPIYPISDMGNRLRSHDVPVH